jgi:hypothetical protein
MKPFKGKKKCSPLLNEMFGLGVVWAHLFKIPTTQTKAKVGVP